MLDGAGGLDGWMERVERLPGVSCLKFTIETDPIKYSFVPEKDTVKGILYITLISSQSQTKVSTYLSRRPDVVGVGENPRLQPKKM